MMILCSNQVIFICFYDEQGVSCEMVVCSNLNADYFTEVCIIPVLHECQYIETIYYQIILHQNLLEEFWVISGVCKIIFGLIWLFGFYGISTLVGYLMPNPFLYK